MSIFCHLKHLHILLHTISINVVYYNQIRFSFLLTLNQLEARLSLERSSGYLCSDIFSHV